MNSKDKQLAQLKAEIEYYKKLINWYQNTYETRSLLGVVKTKLNRTLKNNITNFKIKQVGNNLPKLSLTRKKQKNEIGKNPGITPTSTIDKSSFYSSHAIDGRLARIGIFVHLFYQDLWPEINGYLKNMGINFDLLLTVNEEDEQCDETIAAIKQDYPYAIILKVPNKGLDIGPFFELVNYVISKNITFDYILKFHTKKSLGVNSAVGEMWRNKSYESLMGSSAIVYHILRVFESQPSIGMIGPYETRMSISVNDVKTGKNANERNIELLSGRLEIKDTQLDFFGGTMFWARWSAYEEKFKKTTLTIHDFEPGYKKDELLSHAMERLLASIIRDAGFKLFELSKVNDYAIYKNKRKKICWVHPGYGIGGGNRVIFDICQEQLKYYDVYSVSYFGQPFNNWMDARHNIMSFHNHADAKLFIETVGMDAVFATGWQTVEFVENLTTVQKKYYFIQDYEPWFSNADAKQAKATYNNSFNANFAIAEWLQQKLYADHNLPSVFVKIGINQSGNKFVPKVTEKPTRILLYFKIKNHYGRGSDLIETLLRQLVKHKDLEINVIGHENPHVDGIIFHGELYKSKLIALYQHCDILVDLSRHRGIATMAMEVSKFGMVSLLSSKNYGLKEYGFEDNINCLFVEGVDDAYQKVLSLSNDAKRYNQLKEGVIHLSQTFQNKYTANDMNQILER
jgi:hypothetical protein